jgi:hypothetical protein
MMARTLFPSTLLVSVAVLLLQPGCRSKSTAKPDAPGPRASASVPQVEARPAPSAEIQAALNPSKEPVYSGPIGTIRGVIRVSGDPSPELPEVKKAIPAGKCDDARAFYGTLFREGPGRELADVLVAVTGYKGYVEATGVSKQVQARGCAFESRTMALVFGQRLDVQNRGPETFIPLLSGAKQAALLVAVPNGDPVKLFPSKVGEYELVDQTHDYAKAAVFVLKYPTVTVTKLDGKYEISGIPAGEVDVSALLPATRGTATQHVKVVAGEATTVDLTIPYSAAKAAP